MSKRQRRRQEKRRRHASMEGFHRRGRQLAVGAGVTVGSTLLMGGVAQAACTCTVDSLADPTDAGHTTLRDAITSANANPGSTITFASGLSGTITLNGTELPQITVPTTIAGPGAGLLTVSGNDLSRVFDINEVTNGDPVTISGLTITGGSVAGRGAGIDSTRASLAVSDAVISGNTTTGVGSHGGGIQVDYGTLTVTRSTISGNTAGARGGGIDTQQFHAGATTIRSSTISGNDASDYGGGAYFNYQSPATVENSTIYGNTAGQGGGGFYHYGALSAPGLTVTGSTINHNEATRGGGIASSGKAPYVQPVLHNTIVFGNTATTGPDLSTLNTGSMSAAFSLIGSVDPATTIDETVPGSDISGDPQLGSLANNGGPTQTQLPANTSPVVNKGSSFGLTTDQRGLTRPVAFPGVANSTAAGADGADIGAVELQLSPTPTPTPTPTPGPTGERAAAKKHCKKKFKHNQRKRKKCLKKAKRLPV